MVLSIRLSHLALARFPQSFPATSMPLRLLALFLPYVRPAGRYRAVTLHGESVANPWLACAR